MASLDDLLPEIMVEIENCSKTQAEMALRSTIRDFCRKTHYWQQDITPITLLPFNVSSPATYIYTLTVPDESEMMTLSEVIYNASPLKMVTTGYLNENLTRWREDEGDPLYYLMMSDKTIRFVPHSNTVQANAITGRMVLRPTRYAQAFSDDLLEYDNGLVSGALARLHAMPKSWASPKRVSSCYAQYMDSVSAAKLSVMQEFSDGVMTGVRKTWL